MAAVRDSGLGFTEISTSLPKAFKNLNNLSVEKPDNLPLIKAETLGHLSLIFLLHPFELNFWCQ